jgi:hypothetical protein
MPGCMTNVVRPTSQLDTNYTVIDNIVFREAWLLKAQPLFMSGTCLERWRGGEAGKWLNVGTLVMDTGTKYTQTMTD